MLRTRVIPSLLLKGEGLVKTLRFKNPKYVGDPINAIKIFNDKEVDELVLLDISATNQSKGPAFDTITQIASECFMPVAYGGGIATVDQMRRILNSGVEKVILNSVTFSNPDIVRQAADEFGSQAVIASMDVKRKLLGGYEVLSHSGTRKTGHEPVKWAMRMEERGAGEILLNAIDRDGMMGGYDLDLVSRVCEAVSIPVIAAGGAGSVSDFAKATDAGAGAVSAGAMFVFHGPHRAVLITYPKLEELASI